MSSLSCPICQKQFTKRYSMKRHYIRIHPNVEMPEYLSPKAKDSMKCAMCDSVLHNFNDLECHLLKHNIILESEIITFESETEFYSWKKRLEEAEKVQYVQNTGKRLSTNNNITTYYVCHRSGCYKPMVSSLERKRQLKIQGSSKINAFCPSRIKASFQSGGNVIVEFCWTHLGHSNDLAHLNDVKSKIGLSADKNQLNSRVSSSSGNRTIDFKNIIPSDNDFRKIKFRHKMSLTLGTDSVVECSTGSQPAWNVGTAEELQCRVKSLKTVCDCLLFCKYCKACSHKYSCTCPDASVKGNLCKHIHLVCRVSNLNGNIIEHNKSSPLQTNNGSNCESDQLVNCEANQLKCQSDQLMNCESVQLNCEANQLNCEANQLNCEANQLNCEANQLDFEVNQLSFEANQFMNNCEANQLNCDTNQINYAENQLNFDNSQLIFDDLNQNNVSVGIKESFDAKQEIFDEFKSMLESAKSEQEINLLRIGVRGLKAFIETIGITQDKGIQLPKFNSNSNEDDSVIQFMII